MSRKISFFIMLLLLCIPISLIQAQSTQNTLDNLTYHLYEPDNPDGLLIALHPTASSGNAMQALTGLNDYAHEHNWLVVYPDSPGLRWSDSNSESDDVALIITLIEQLQTAYDIAPDATYLTGYGTGGILALELMCTLPESPAGIAITAAMPVPQVINRCEESTLATNLLILRGEEDLFYQRDGNTTIQSMSVEDTLSFYSDLMTCEPGETDTSTLITQTCADDHQLAYYEITDAPGSWLRTDKDYALNQFGFDTTERVVQFFTGDDDWQRPQDDYDIDTLARTYVSYVPKNYAPGEALPVLLMLHGKTSNGVNTAASTDMNTIANRENFIVIYPDGIDAQWNYVRDVPFYPDHGYDDTVFLDNLVDDLSLNLNIDSSRLYVSGISNGGFMTQRLACEAPERYAAFASVIAQGFGGLFPLCDEAFPVPMMMINGTQDTIVPWAGIEQTVRGGTYQMIIPVQDTVFTWATHNNCDPDDFTIEDMPESPDDTSGTTIKVMDFANCNGDGRIILYAVVGGGHTLPGIDWNFPALGATNMDINGSEEIWNFLSQYSHDD